MTDAEDAPAEHDPARIRTVTWQDPMPGAHAARSLSGLAYLHALQAGEYPPPPVLQLLGITIVEVAEGRAVFGLEPAEFHYNPIGSVHGGVAATILDSAMGCAVHTLLPAGTGYTTLEMKVSLVRAITTAAGPLRCEGTTLHIGSRTATAEGRLCDEAGKLYAHGTTTCLLFRGHDRRPVDSGAPPVQI